MTKPYDAAGKDLIEADPAGWLALFGVHRPAGVVTVIDADVSAVTAAADKVIRVADPAPWLLHLELQADRDADLPARVLMYHAVLHARHKLPVASAVLLLRPAAAPGVTGVLGFAPPGGPAWEFRYAAVRLWEVPPAALLNGPLATLPLAPVSAVSRAELPGVVRRVRERIGREADPSTAGRLETATLMLLGLRYPKSLIEAVMFKLDKLRSSTVYQAILEEGRAEGQADEARRLLLSLGEAKFGPPPRRLKRVIADLSDLARIEALHRAVLTAAGWDDLFPPAR